MLLLDASLIGLLLAGGQRQDETSRHVLPTRPDSSLASSGQRGMPSAVSLHLGNASQPVIEEPNWMAMSPRNFKHKANESVFLLQRLDRASLPEVQVANPMATSILHLREKANEAMFLAQRLDATKSHDTAVVQHQKDIRHGKQSQARYQLQIEKEAPHGSSLSFVAALVFAGIMIVLACLERCYKISSSANETARAVGNLLIFVQISMYTMAIVDAYQIVQTFGMSASYSGFCIGAFMAGNALGGTLLYFWMLRNPQIHLECPHMLLLVGQLCLFIGTFLCYQAARSSSVDLPNVDTFAYGRAISGVGGGIVQMHTRVTNLELTERADRPEQVARTQFAVMLGLGFGPVLVACTHMLNSMTGSPAAEMDHPAAIFLVGLVFCVGAMYLVYLYPSPDELMPVPCESEETSLQEETTRRQMIVASGWLLNITRSYVVAGLESGTALILEKKYGYSSRSIGLVIGMTFLFCVPLRMLQLASRGWIADVAVIQICSCVAIFGSVFLFDVHCESWAGGDPSFCAGILITGDGVLFPTLYVSESLAGGIMSQYFLPDPSLFSLKNTQFWCNTVLANGAARFLGPWTARLMIDWKGQNLYAATQLFFCLLFALIFQIGVVRQLQTPDESSQQVNPSNSPDASSSKDQSSHSDSPDATVS